MPAGWFETTIDELRSAAQHSITDGPYGSNLKSSHYTASGPTVVRLGNVGRRRYIDNDRACISESHFSSLRKHHVFAGDIIVAALGDPLGRSCLLPNSIGPALVKADCFRFRPSSETDATYLMLWLNSEDASRKFHSASHGLGRVRINLSDFREVRVPIAPLQEQRRIVAKIESLSAKSERARDHLDHVPRLVEKYKQAIISAAYLGRLRDNNANPVRMSPVGELIETLDQGWSPKCERNPASNPDDWAVIKTTAIQPIHFNGEENKKLPKSLTPRPGIVIEPDDVLITRAGPRSRVAISCVVKETRQRLMLCDKAYRLKVKPSTDATYLTMMLNAPQSLERLEQMKTGISDSGLNLTQAKFLELAIPAPALAEQQKIVHSIESAFSWIDRLASEAIGGRKLIDCLDQAILAKAFQGELVPQDPSEEPASLLLERIRAERATATVTGRRRNKRPEAPST